MKRPGHGKELLGVRVSGEEKGAGQTPGPPESVQYLLQAGGKEAFKSKRLTKMVTQCDLYNDGYKQIEERKSKTYRINFDSELSLNNTEELNSLALKNFRDETKNKSDNYFINLAISKIIELY